MAVQAEVTLAVGGQLAWGVETADGTTATLPALAAALVTVPTAPP